MNNECVMIIRDSSKTRLFFADQHGKFETYPNMAWMRELSDDECMALLENPWDIFGKPEPEPC